MRLSENTPADGTGRPTLVGSSKYSADLLQCNMDYHTRGIRIGFSQHQDSALINRPGSKVGRADCCEQGGAACCGP